MANIKSMEMAKAIFAIPYIENRSSFFGLSSSVIYKPTQSKLKGHTLDFDVETGKKVKRLLDTPKAEWAAEAAKVGRLKPTQAMGNVLLELAVSTDHQFAAAQVLQYSDLSYQPVGDTHFFEGHDAELLCSMFGL